MKLELSLSPGNEFIYSYNHCKSPNGLCIFVHGLGDSKNSFIDLNDFLIYKNYDTILFDLPGFSDNKNVVIDKIATNYELLKAIIDKHSQLNKEIIFICHSMGALIVLLFLLKNKYENNFVRIFAIEPTLTLPDVDFFKRIRKPPNGIGYQGLIERVKISNNYIETYLGTLKNSSEAMFNLYVDTINQNIMQYRKQIFNSNIPFFYVYGGNSIDPNKRQEVDSYSNITMQLFNKAGHWVHIDCREEFKKFILSNIGVNDDRS